MYTKKYIIAVCSLLLLIGIPRLNSFTYVDQADFVRASAANVTNTPEYNYLPIILKPAGTPTPIPTVTVTPAPTTTPVPTITPVPTATETSIPSPADIKITFIEYNPPGIDAEGEFVRLENMGTTAHDMTNWTLRDAVNTVFTFPAFTLQPGASVEVWVKSGTNTATDLYWGRGSSVWTNTGDTATLRDDLGQEADSCTYAGGGAGVACP